MGLNNNKIRSHIRRFVVLKYIASVSGGAGSTLAAHRAVEKHGMENVVLVFADTNTEHQDLYRLLDHMDKALKPVIRLSDGRDIWDCFDDHGIIRTPTGACKAKFRIEAQTDSAVGKGQRWP